MSRLALFHWHAAEAAERAAFLRKAGHQVQVCSKADPAVLQAVAADPPQAVVIDLRRLPAQGREVGAWLRRRKATREVPLVFVEGDPEKTGRVRTLLPDAVFTPWARVRSAVRGAVKRSAGGATGAGSGKAGTGSGAAGAGSGKAGAAGDKAAKRGPVVPSTMDYYAGVSLAKKLGIREGSTVMLLDAPSEYPSALGALPEGVTVKRAARGSASVVLLFAGSVRALERRFESATGAVAKQGRLWILWPKQASGVKSDLTQAAVRAYGLERKWVDFKIAAIDATWSGLAFVPRKKNG